MELYQLRAFVAVAEEGNVTRAAERLFTSQPAVSGQIKALVGTLGVQLFTRTPVGMTLTEAGRRLLHEAREALQRAQRVEDLAKHLRDGTAGVLRLGLNSPVSKIPLEAITRRLMALCPDLQLQLHTGSSGDIVRKLRNFELDAGFAEGPLEAGMHRLPVGENVVRIVAPIAWADDLRGGDWWQLQRHPWVFATPDCSYFRLFERLATEHGLSLNQQFRIDEAGTTMHFVKCGLAMSLTDGDTADAAAEAGEAHVWPDFSAKLPHHAIALQRRIAEKPIEAFFTACAEVYGVTTVKPRRGAKLAAAG